MIRAIRNLNGAQVLPEPDLVAEATVKGNGIVRMKASSGKFIAITVDDGQFAGVAMNDAAANGKLGVLMARPDVEVCIDVYAPSEWAITDRLGHFGIVIDANGQPSLDLTETAKPIFKVNRVETPIQDQDALWAWCTFIQTTNNNTVGVPADPQG